MTQEAMEKLCMRQRREPGVRQGGTGPERFSPTLRAASPGPSPRPFQLHQPALCTRKVLGLNNTRHLMTYIYTVVALCPPLQAGTARLSPCFATYGSPSSRSPRPFSLAREEPHTAGLARPGTACPLIPWLAHGSSMGSPPEVTGRSPSTAPSCQPASHGSLPRLNPINPGRAATGPAGQAGLWWGSVGTCRGTQRCWRPLSLPTAATAPCCATSPRAARRPPRLRVQLGTCVYVRACRSTHVHACVQVRACGCRCV